MTDYRKTIKISQLSSDDMLSGKDSFIFSRYNDSLSAFESSMRISFDDVYSLLSARLLNDQSFVEELKERMGIDSGIIYFKPAY